MHPRDESVRYLVVVGRSRARIGFERDQWRLFDLVDRRVYFVDDIEKTVYSASFDELLSQRKRAADKPLPIPVSRASFEDTGAVQTFIGLPARQYVLELGAYRRELWMSTADLVPAPLFPAVLASDPMTGEYTGLLKDAWPGLAALRGYPLFDVAAMPFQGRELRIERRVERVERRMVPASWLEVPAGYRDLDGEKTGDGQVR